MAFGTSDSNLSPSYLVMFKPLLVAAILIPSVIAMAATPQDKKDDNSVHHAAIHAEKWVDHHVSAPHHKVAKRRRPIHRKKSKTVHHAVMHAEHWIDHHVSAPHKKTGN